MPDWSLTVVFENLKVLDKQIIISQLANDTTLFLKDEHQFPLPC